MAIQGLVRFRWFVPVLCLVLAGCGPGGSARPDLIPVKGTVLYNGKPIEGATVTFWHETAPRSASGTTDAEGKYTLTMYEPGDGAMAGENIITVSKAKPGEAAKGDPMAMLNDPQAMAKAAAAQSAEGSKEEKPLIPEKYAQKTTSGLKEVISAENNTIPIQLVD